MGSVRKCARMVAHGAWGRWIGVFVFALFVSGIEAVGTAAIYLLLNLITSPDAPIDLPIVGDITDVLPDIEPDELVLVAALSIGGFFIVRGVLFVLNAYVRSRVAFGAGSQLSVRLLRGYLGMPYEFHLRRNSAELIRNAFDTVQVLVRDVLVPTSRLVSEAMIALGVLGVLVATAPSATLIALAVLGPSVAILLGVVHPRLKRMGAVSQEMSTLSLKALAQSLGGIRDIKVLAKEAEFVAEFEAQRDEHARANYLRGGAREIPRVALETMLVLFIMGFFVTSEIAGDGSGSTLSVLGLFAYGALRLKPSLTAVMSGFNSVRFAAAAIDELYDDLVLVESEGAIPQGPVTPMPFERKIEIENVSFRYEMGTTPVLHGVDLTITPGQWIGIVGPTGGGKSTLLDLILGLLEPTEGKVMVDGVNIHDNIRGWQHNIGVVPQTVFIIDATLRENICLGVPRNEIDEERLQETIRLAQLETFVADLPDGLETIVGEAGARVSGGQRQRIAIARALYRRPQVLFFDEGTSALDNLTEAELVRELERLKGTRTIITVAHRLSTVRGCDSILVMRDGQIVDRGTYDELGRQSTTFREMTET